jgi:WD40 repeat protein
MLPRASACFGADSLLFASQLDNDGAIDFDEFVEFFGSVSNVKQRMRAQMAIIKGKMQPTQSDFSPSIEVASSAEAEEGSVFTVLVRLPAEYFSMGEIVVALNGKLTARGVVESVIRQVRGPDRTGGGKKGDVVSVPTRRRLSSADLIHPAPPQARNYSLVVNSAVIPDSTHVADIAFLLKSVPFVELRSTHVPKVFIEACAQVLRRGLDVPELFLWPVSVQQRINNARTAERSVKRGSTLRKLSFRPRSAKSADCTDADAVQLEQLRQDTLEIEESSASHTGPAKTKDIWGSANIIAVAEIIVLSLFKRTEPLCRHDLFRTSACAKIAQKVIESQNLVSAITPEILRRLVESIGAAERDVLFLVIRMLFLYSRNTAVTLVTELKLATIFGPIIFGGASLLPSSKHGKRHPSSDDRSASHDWLPAPADPQSIEVLVCEALIANFETVFQAEISEQERDAHLPQLRGTILAHQSSVNGMCLIRTDGLALLSWSSSECRIWSVRGGSIAPGRLGYVVRDLPRADPIMDVVAGQPTEGGSVVIWVASVRRIQAFSVSFSMSEPSSIPKLSGVEKKFEAQIGCASLCRCGPLVLGSPCSGPGVSLWDSESMESIGHMPTPRVLTCMKSVGEDESQLWGGTEDGGICVWSVLGKSLALEAHIPSKGNPWPGLSPTAESPHRGKIRSIVSVPASARKDGESSVWTSGNDGLICRWDTRTRTAQQSIQSSKGKASLVYHLGFLWCATWEGTIRVLSGEGGLVVELKGPHSDGVTSLAFSFDDARCLWTFFSASYDRSVALWVIPDGRTDHLTKLLAPRQD